ncbi:PQQ-binding-like beta-propeller repeat protein [Micromonospora sp. NPDC051196]|uniref:outer membrane protein assembly factor BamB family protein n=1 Tax=Micromonospora sp. NPDC051196 TaxID=3155281 RepID=UPI0034421013
MTVIDLGDRAEPTDAQPSHRRRAGRFRPLLVPVTLVVLLALTGAAPPALRMQAILPSSLAAEVFLTGDQIVAVVPVREAGDDSQEVLAYRRPARVDGAPQPLAPLWRLPIGSNRVSVAEHVGDGGLVLSLFGTDNDKTETMLLDSRTGQLRWRQPGIATLDGSGRVLLRTYDGQEPIVLASVELATGRVLWSLPLVARFAAYHQRSAVIDAIVVTTVAGDVEVLDPRTGVSRGRLPAAFADAGPYQHASVVGDLVLVPNSTGVAAYHVDGLERRWQTTLPPVAWVHRCGVLACARVDDGGGVHILDPTTGAVRWRVVEDVDVLRAGDARALVVDHGSSPLTVAFVAADTGRVVADGERWDLVDEFGDAPHLLGTRSVRDVGVVLARLDPAHAQPRRIDVLPGAAGNCGHRADLIVCRRQDGDFGVWQLRGGEDDRDVDRPR